MKICVCGQKLGENVSSCPTCGCDSSETREFIDDFRILEFVHEGNDCILYRARKEDAEQDVLIRIYKPQSGITDDKAKRLQEELDAIKGLPSDRFVTHYKMAKSSDGVWYRVSEWIDAAKWGDLISEGYFTHYENTFPLFSKIAQTIEELHKTRHIIPHLTFDDIIIQKQNKENLSLKIDYKLSRFIDPKLRTPSPVLRHLLENHPDILEDRPLDYRSDIWSLAKIFMDILSGPAGGDKAQPRDYLKQIDSHPLPYKVQVLLRQMLANDPDQRPASMAVVANVFGKVSETDIQAAKKSFEQRSVAPSGVSRKVLKRTILAGIILLFLVAGTGLFLHFKYRIFWDDDQKMAHYAEKYKDAIAFVLVEYWLKSGAEKVFSNAAAGTAFLVDESGYLFSNRHVICPWISDTAFASKAAEISELDKRAEFGYKIFLFFEGEKAFNLSGRLLEKPEYEDVFFVENGFSTGGTNSVDIAGVLPAPNDLVRSLQFPLGMDVGVLKIENCPKGKRAIPLDNLPLVKDIPKGSTVFTLGFPKGIDSQKETVNASFTKGHIRRIFENQIQSDLSLHGGNSGGPVINANGKLIGIASAGKIEQIEIPEIKIDDSTTVRVPPLNLFLSDFTLINPIHNAISLLKHLKAGGVAWNGLIDPSLQQDKIRICEAVDEGRWADVMAIMEEKIRTSTDADFISWCSSVSMARNQKDAQQWVRKALSINPDNGFAKWMLFIIDWENHSSGNDSYKSDLLSLDWRSPDEFYGYLARLLTEKIPFDSALNAPENDNEKAWVSFVGSLLALKESDLGLAQKRLENAVIASEQYTPIYFLSSTKLENLQEERLKSLKGDQKEKYMAGLELFNNRLENERQRRKMKEMEKALKMLFLRAKINANMEKGGAPDEGANPQSMELVEAIVKIDPENTSLLTLVSFLSAAEGNWSQSLNYADRYLEKQGRESVNRLRMGLFRGQLMNMVDQKKTSREVLRSFIYGTSDPWYKRIAECLLDELPCESLEKTAILRPEDLLTLNTALGLQAEGNGDGRNAIKYYKAALESLLADWPEFMFSRGRIAKLKVSEKKGTKSGKTN